MIGGKVMFGHLRSGFFVYLLLPAIYLEDPIFDLMI